MLDVLREVQVPLLAVLLIGGCAAKASARVSRAVRQRGDRADRVVPAAACAVRRRSALCATELVLGVGLLLTAGRAGAGAPALRLPRSGRAAVLHGGRRAATSCGRAGRMRAAAASANSATRR